MADPLIPGWALPWGVLACATLTIAVTTFSALLERSGPIRVRHWAEEAGGRLRTLFDSPSRFETFRMLLSLLARVLLLPLILLLDQWLDSWWLAFGMVATVIVWIEWLARLLVERHAELALRLSTLPMRVAHGLLAPLIWLVHWAVPVAASEVDDDEDEASEEEINAFIDVGVREGILEPEDEDLVRSIVDFSDTRVRSIMTPRVEMTSVAVDAELEAVAKVFFESKRARVPVYRESIDEVVGILHIRDLFEAMHAGRENTLEQLAKPPFYVPEHKPLPELLGELQTRHQPMAIVVDEYGGVAGLVTVEDLLEEIVGEINDEHEATGVVPIRLEDGGWRISGRTDLEDLLETFDLDADIDDLPYETVSGLVCGELGHVPEVGEELQSHGLLIRVEEADERRVTTVIVRPMDSTEASPPELSPSLNDPTPKDSTGP